MYPLILTIISKNPPQGFAPHYDDIDAFVLQLEGSKRWRRAPMHSPAQTTHLHAPSPCSAWLTPVRVLPPSAGDRRCGWGVCLLCGAHEKKHQRGILTRPPSHYPPALPTPYPPLPAASTPRLALPRSCPGSAVGTSLRRKSGNPSWRRDEVLMMVDDLRQSLRMMVEPALPCLAERMQVRSLWLVSKAE